jgi:hypothetical protein
MGLVLRGATVLSGRRILKDPQKRSRGWDSFGLRPHNFSARRLNSWIVPSALHE